ncbi:hypothetical protein GF357_03835 [Candidatus Dojkabacteria bacterium]|nr:hypothetical protein [Candidatus Dojkabacteria bacterium]
MKYIISYDLRNQRDYEDLYDALKAFSGSRKVLESVWLVESSKTRKEVADSLLDYLDSDDGIIVADYNGYAYKNLLE